MSKHAPPNRIEALKAAILLGFGGMLAYFLISDKIKMYINPRFTALTIAADVVICLLFLAQASKLFGGKASIDGHGHQHAASAWALAPFILPLLFVFLMPNATLDTGTATERGINIGPGNASPATPEPVSASAGNIASNSDQTQNGSSYQRSSPSSQHDYGQDSNLNVTDDNFVYLISQIYETPEKFVGKNITMLGFVVRDEDFSPQQMGVVRYVITCYTADAMPCGLLCEYEKASSLQDGAWVKISGTISMARLRNKDFAAVKIQSAQPVPKPEMPYVYPTY